MACDGSSEKDISVAFEKLSVTSSNQTSSQQKTIVKIHLLCRVKYYLQYIKLGKAKIVLMLKQLRKKSIKAVAQVLMKATLRSIHLNYYTRKLSLMLKLHNI